MTKQGNPPAPTPRPRERIEEERQRGERNQVGSGDPEQGQTLPGGKDPRESQFPGRYSTERNVTTEEQEAAQAARKEGDMTTADEQYGAQASRAEQVESQVASGENPLSPQSTTAYEPHGERAGMGLMQPPRPEGQKPIVPRGTGPQRFDPQTGAPNMGAQRRARLEEDDDPETEVELAGPLTLTDDHGTVHTYGPGKQKVPRSHATHWYLKQHLVKPKGDEGAKKQQEDEKQPRKKAE